MNIKKIFKSLGALSLAAVMALMPASGVFAEESDSVIASKAADDIIDTDRKGSITIHKYDITDARTDGVQDQFTANGKQDTAAESAFADYVIQGVKFTYLRVSDIVQRSENGEIVLVYQIDDALETILGLTPAEDNYHTSAEINDGLKNILETGNTEAKNALERYVEQGQGRQTTEETDEQGVINIPNLQVGLYLFVETYVPANVYSTTDPFFVSIPMTDLEGNAWFYDVHLYPKNQTDIPTLDKQVRQHDDAESETGESKDFQDSATVSEGDIVDYYIISHLPKITSTATYLKYYTFKDYMDHGLVYNQDEDISIYENEQDAIAGENKTYTFTRDSEYEVTYSTSGSRVSRDPGYSGGNGYMEGPDFEGSGYSSRGSVSKTAASKPPVGNYKNRVHAFYEFTEDGMEYINTQCSEKWIAIHYTVTVNSDESPILGDKGNTNDVQLTWERTNDQYVDYEDARARVYTYSLNITKEFQGDEEHAEGNPLNVQFILYNDTDKYYVTADWERSTTGLYYVTGNTKADSEDAATKFSPNEHGGLVINGLEADTYILTEVQTDKGYTLLKSPIYITITRTKDEFTPSVTVHYDTKDEHTELLKEHKNDASATVDSKNVTMSPEEIDDDSSTNAFVDMTITNTPGFKLPATGGIGTILFTIAGCSVAFIGIAFLTRKKKDKDDEKTE